MERLSEPRERGDGWVSLDWGGYDVNQLSSWSNGSSALDGRADWRTAFHETPLYGLFSTLAYGALLPEDSMDEDNPHHRPGIRLQPAQTIQEVESSAGHHDLLRDGTFWRTVWEVRCDRSQRVILNAPTEHWMQSPGSIQLVRLWVQRTSWRRLPYGSWVYHRWDPLLEANPARGEAGGHVPAVLPLQLEDPEDYNAESHFSIPLHFGEIIDAKDLCPLSENAGTEMAMLQSPTPRTTQTGPW